MKSKSSFSVSQTAIKALFALVVVFSLFVSPLKADERDKANQKRAQEMLDVISGQVKRQMYDTAQGTISSIDSSDEFILNEKQLEQLAAYREEAAAGIAAQTGAAVSLEKIDKYVSDMDYALASTELESVQSLKKYLSSEQLNSLTKAQAEVDALAQTIKSRAKKQFAQSKEYYKQGNYKEARIGFEAVSASGIELSFFDRGGDFGTADTYLEKINQKEVAMANGQEVQELDTEPLADGATSDESATVAIVSSTQPKKSGGFWPFGGSSSKKLSAEEVEKVEKLIAYGDLALTKKKYQQARQFFLEALAMNPDNVTAQKFLTVAEYHINRPVNQAEEVKMSILDKYKQQEALQVQAVKSNWFDVRERTANLVAEGKYAAALSAIVQSLASIESNRQVLGDTAYVALKTEAEELRTQVEKYKSDAEAKSLEQKRQEAAERQREIADKVEAERQKNVANLFAIANQYSEKRRYQDAINTMDTLLNADPDNETAKYLRNSYEQGLLWQMQQETAREGDRNVVKLLIDADESLIPPTGKVEYPTAKEWLEKSKRVPEESDVATNKKMTQERVKTVRINIEFEDFSLSEALDSISEQGNVVILPMWPELDIAGITQDSLVTVKNAKMSIGKAIDFVLDYVSAGALGKAGYEVDEEGNIIVKIVGDDYGYEFRTYYIGDLVRPTTSGGGGYGGGMGGYGGGMGGGMMGGGMMGGMGGMGGMMGGMGGMMGGMGGMMGGMGGGMMGGMGRYNQIPDNNQNNDNDGKRQPNKNELINLGFQDGEYYPVAPNAAIPAGNNSNGTPADMQFVQYGGGNNNGGIGGNNNRGNNNNNRGGGSYGGGYGGGGTQNYQQISELNSLLMMSIAPNSWRYGMGNMRMMGMGGGLGNQQDPELMQLNQQGFGMIIPFRSTYFNIYQTPDVHQEIADFLATLRTMHGDQVSIESRLLTINNNTLVDIGVDIDVLLNAAEYGWDKWSDVTIEQNHANWASPPSATGITGSLGGGAMPSSFLMSGSFLDNIQVDFLIRATKGNKRSRMLTAPHVTVFNGENAYVNFSKEFVYVSEMSPVAGVGVIGYDVETDTLNSGIELDITPYISHDKRYVLMNIAFEQEILDSMFDFSYISGDQESTVDTVDGTTVANQGDMTVRIQLPQTSVTEIDTKVSVPDGGTLLLGGQKLVGETEQESGVPGLAHIPFLNRLFSTRNNVKDENIILVLIKPQIIIQREMEEDNFGSMELDTDY